MPRIAVVLTTINLPGVLAEYAANARHYGHIDIFFVVVGDRKSPPECGAFLATLTQEYPLEYLGLEEQAHWLKPHPSLDRLLPYDSVQRRNLGFLVAVERGAEVLISIDDDNVPLLEYDYFTEHATVGQRIEAPQVDTSSGWFNSCSLLENEPDRLIYHRGYPQCQRWLEQHVTWTEGRSEVLVNVGLWLEDPDVDTVTRLEGPLRVNAVAQPHQRLLLASGLCCPFNSQNTSFAASLLPAMYLIALRHTHRGVLSGNNNFRYDDIWMSYFLKKVVDRVGGSVAIGPPHVRQLRNRHDLLLDLEKEVYPMQLTDRFPQLLPRLELSACDPFGCYAELADQLPQEAAEIGLPEPDVAVFRETSEGMKVWLEVVERVQSRR